MRGCDAQEFDRGDFEGEFLVAFSTYVSDTVTTDGSYSW